MLLDYANRVGTEAATPFLASGSLCERCTQLPKRGSLVKSGERMQMRFSTALGHAQA